MFWSGMIFGAFVLWSVNEWCALLARKLHEINARRRNAEHFRRMEASAVIVAQRLTDAEKAAIRLELYR